MRLILASLAALPLLLPAMPAAAQRTERVLVIFGNDPCPTNGNGEEIIVCARRPEAERYRIPQELRPRGQSPDSKSWAVRAQSTLDTGRTGTGSCSATGAGGWTGCWAEQMRQAKEEARQKAAADRDVP
ncbi:MAG: hypothetical protein ACKOXK_01730 [Chakrabartia sp.]